MMDTDKDKLLIIDKLEQVGRWLKSSQGAENFFNQYNCLHAGMETLKSAFILYQRLMEKQEKERKRRGPWI